MNLAEKERTLAGRYLLIEDPQERLAAITAKGKRWPSPPDEQLLPEALVAGCVSRVWLTAELRDGRCYFFMRADSPLVQGLAALLCEVCEGAARDEVLAFEPGILSQLGLDRSLSPTRLAGLRGVAQAIRQLASALA
jgi:cysteine desulfuration protein SufE